MLADAAELVEGSDTAGATATVFNAAAGLVKCLAVCAEVSCPAYGDLLVQL